jgi:crotonobetainyl-CoA:carnitine CoA-transferase CaiB-like acyl-CoA transferase
VKHSNEWFSLRAACLANEPTAHWLAVFEAADIPAMPCNTLRSLPEDPHLKAVHLIEDSEHPVEGRVRAIRPTILFDGEARRQRVPAREAGADTRRVLEHAGFDAAGVDRLIRVGAAAEAGASAAAPTH